MTQESLGDFAKQFQPKNKATQNISVLPKVSTKVNIVKEMPEGKRTWEQYTITVEGLNYRVPLSVIEQLQLILKFKPELEYFRVTKTGTTKDDTKYTVVPVL